MESLTPKKRLKKKSYEKLRKDIGGSLENRVKTDSSLKRSWKSGDEFIKKLKKQLYNDSTTLKSKDFSQDSRYKFSKKSVTKRTARSAESSKESQLKHNTIRNQRINTEAFERPQRKNKVSFKF